MNLNLNFKRYGLKMILFGVSLNDTSREISRLFGGSSLDRVLSSKNRLLDRLLDF